MWGGPTASRTNEFIFLRGRRYCDAGDVSLRRSGAGRSNSGRSKSEEGGTGRLKDAAGVFRSTGRRAPALGHGGQFSPRHQTHLVYPRLLSYVAPYDVASNIWRAIPGLYSCRVPQLSERGDAR